MVIVATANKSTVFHHSLVVVGSRQYYLVASGTEQFLLLSWREKCGVAFPRRHGGQSLLNLLLLLHYYSSNTYYYSYYNTKRIPLLTH